jgi:UDP-N-acetylmuramoyl-tripeptide--D-alanyl-D-alanine ligase
MNTSTAGRHRVSRLLTPQQRARITARLAKAWRRTLGAMGTVCFVGVTGSCGKTMTKELIAAILSSQARGLKSTNLWNGPVYLAQTMLTIRPWHRFCVHEMGTQEIGMMAQSCELFRPDVGVVTHVGLDHYTSFRSKEGVAAEKGTLVESLPANGVAVLNADDPHVLAMRNRTRARIVTYGLAPEAMVCGEEITSDWPDRLALTVRHHDEKVRINTKLLGEHWASSVLASVATGIARGVALSDCARAVEQVAPFEGRMSPDRTSDGITFVRDDWKAPLWTISASLRFMQTARARRRVVIIGTISDYPGESTKKYRAAARQALEVAEVVIFVGRYAHNALKVRTDPSDGRLMGFDTVYELSRFLRDFLSPGDLVLLKGSGTADHLQRLVLARDNGIECWRANCRQFIFCTDCALRLTPALPNDSQPAPA